MFELFRIKIKKDFSNVYVKRTVDVLAKIGTFLLVIIGLALGFVLFIVGFIVLGMIGVPIVLAISLLEFILVPIPFYIITGDHYYDVNSSLITKYVGLIDELESFFI